MHSHNQEFILLIPTAMLFPLPVLLLHLYSWSKAENKLNHTFVSSQTDTDPLQKYQSYPCHQNHQVTGI